MIVGSIVVALVAVGGLIAALALDGGTATTTRAAAAIPARRRPWWPGTRGRTRRRRSSGPSARSRTSRTTTQNKIQVPDFTYKYIESVKSCLQAAGWQMKIKHVDENAYGEGTVMNQFPSADTDVDPKNMPEIQLYVSTGNPA